MNPHLPPLHIRRATPADAAGIAAKMGDPSVYPGVLQLPYPSEAAWRARLEESSKPGSADHVLVAERAGHIVGSGGLHLAHPSARKAHVRMLGLSVLGSAQGQGIGSALMAALCDLADNWLGVLRLELTVYSDNARAIALYERFGFVREGLHRGDALRNGVFVDSLSMARWHPHPPQRAA